MLSEPLDKLLQLINHVIDNILIAYVNKSPNLDKLNEATISKSLDII